METLPVINTKLGKLPVYFWVDPKTLEEDTIMQAQNMSNHPFAYHHIAIMPDAHVGFGVCIGGVIATKDYIIPNAVGVDIGCGVHAIQTSLKVSKKFTQKLYLLLSLINQRIPTGFDWHKKPLKSSFWHKVEIPESPVITKEWKRAHYQMGTLGGGNHFIEIQKDDNDYIWIMLHSGSRNIGLQIANYYHKIAKEFCLKEKINIPTLDLACLPLSGKAGKEYFEAMNYALEFAKHNRKLMTDVIIGTLQDFTVRFNLDSKFALLDEIDVHHNFAAQETHFGQKVIVHRKGAIAAFKDKPVIIPGSMGTNSYIGVGKENPDSFMSCSHGAGRIMGRKEAIRRLKAKEIQQYLQNKGILVVANSKRGFIEEAPQVYKDIDQVIKNAKSLVTIKTRLIPIGAIKG